MPPRGPLGLEYSGAWKRKRKGEGGGGKERRQVRGNSGP